MSDQSDSDSSPKAPSSSGSSSAGDDDKKHSSDDSGSSDGVLVELPANPDQETRGVGVDPDSGILVNIDGSTQETQDEGTDSGREDNFEDATDEPPPSPAVLAATAGSGAGRNIAGSLEESMAMIEIGESSVGRDSEELVRVRARFEEALAECRKYREEREVFGREVSSLKRQLQDIINHHSLSPDATRSDELDFASPTPLHSMLADCSRFVLHLKTLTDEQTDSDITIQELKSTLHAKEQEIEDLKTKSLESSVSRDVIFSYLGSIQESWTDSLRERLLPSLESVIFEEKNKNMDGLSLIEKKTLLLVEKHTQLLSEIDQFKQYLLEFKPDFAYSGTSDSTGVLSIAREELLDSKKKEADSLERINKLEEDNRSLVEQMEKMKASLDTTSAEASKLKRDLEQSESKFLSTKEKLSMAVTKGKSLVQHRDSLKHSLAEKTSELERCMSELKQKSDALQATETSLEELKKLLEEKTIELENSTAELGQKYNALQESEKILEDLRNLVDEKTSEIESLKNELEAAKASADELNSTRDLFTSLQESFSQKEGVIREIENVIPEMNLPEELVLLGAVEKVKWFVNQKQAADLILTEYNKVKDALSLVDIPENITSSELDSQVNWLVSSLNQAIGELTKIQEETSQIQLARESDESKISSLCEEIGSLNASLLEEKQEKDNIRNELTELVSKYQDISERLTVVSSEKDGLIRALEETFEITVDSDGMVIEEYVGKIREKAESSLLEREKIESLQSLLYERDQELVLCKKLLEEDTANRSELIRLSDDLQRMSGEIVNLTNERNSLQKELERVEEKTSLLREKLSMAVKKGKGLVQEREGFKRSLEEKSSEIEKLKHELQSKENAIVGFEEQLERLSSQLTRVNELEMEIVSIKEQKEQTERMLDEGKSSLEMLVEVEVAKKNVETELNNVREECTVYSNRLSDALSNIKILENELRKTEEHVSLVTKEKEEILLSKDSIEKELEKIKEEASRNNTMLADSSLATKSLEDLLSQARNQISLLDTGKSEAVAHYEKQIAALNAKLTECMDELAETRGSLERNLSEQSSQLEKLRMLVMDETLISVVKEEFRKKINTLRSMGLLMHEMHQHFTEKGYPIDPSMEVSGFAKFLSLPSYDKFINERMTHRKTGKRSLDELQSLNTIVESLTGQAKYLGDSFKDLSKYTDDHISLISEALQATSEEFFHILEQEESLKLDMEKFEANNTVQEQKLKALSSVCTDAAQEIRVALHDLFDIELRSEGDDDVNLANSLLSSIQKLIVQVRELIDSKDELRQKVEKAESNAQIAFRDHQLYEERVSTLEKDYLELQEVHNEMKNKIGSYEAREELFKAREEEFELLQHRLTAKDIGTNDFQFSEDEMAALINKVKNLNIPFSECEFSNPVEKLFYVMDRIIELKQTVDNLTYEKEELELALASNSTEIEHLKRETEITETKYQELDSKKKELFELTVGLERIMQRLGQVGGKDISQDQKPSNTVTFLSLVERMTVALIVEYESSKSKIQDMETELYAREKVIDELSGRIKMLEESYQSREIGKERGVFEASSSATGSDISEIDDLGPMGKTGISSVTTAAHARTMRTKGSTDHLALNIGPETERLIAAQETDDDDKGHVFKSLNTSGLIPVQGKFYADKVDSIWVSGSRVLMKQPRARLGLIAYCLFLHLWLLGTILL